jgi:hypothetical protein
LVLILGVIAMAFGGWLVHVACSSAVLGILAGIAIGLGACAGGVGFAIAFPLDGSSR